MFIQAQTPRYRIGLHDEVGGEKKDKREIITSHARGNPYTNFNKYVRVLEMLGIV